MTDHASALDGVLRFISALGVPIIGLAGLEIARQQKRIADRRRRNAEFDRVYEVFAVLCDYVSPSSHEDREKAIGSMRQASQKALLFV